MTTTTTPTFWDLLENPPVQAAETAALLSWSLNFDHSKGATPYTVFLDLIGYSDENFGSPLSSYDKIPQVLGYMELDYLADALKEYANNPRTVEAFINDISEAEETK